MAVTVLHQCIRPLIGALLRAIMDISARAISLAARPRPGHLGHQCSRTPGRPNLHLVSSSRRPRQVRINSSHRSKRLTPRPASPRSFGHGPERSKRCVPACWRATSFSDAGSALMTKCRRRTKGRPGTDWPSSNTTISGKSAGDFTQRSSASSYSGTCHRPTPATPTKRMKALPRSPEPVAPTASRRRANASARRRRGWRSSCARWRL